MVAAAAGHSEVAEMICDEEGSDLDLQDKNGDTALHHAGRAGQKELCECLASQGADQNIKNNKGNTPKVRDMENCVVC